MDEREHREVARRIAARLRAENVPVDHTCRRAKDITAEELTKFYAERRAGAIRWSPEPTLREAVAMFVDFNVRRTRSVIASKLRGLAARLDGRP